MKFGNLNWKKWQIIFYHVVESKIDILYSKNFLPNVRKSCSSDWEKLWGHQNNLPIQTVKGQSNF